MVIGDLSKKEFTKIIHKSVEFDRKYGYLDYSEREDGVLDIKIELLSDTMLEYDSAFIRQIKNFNSIETNKLKITKWISDVGYHPYFFEFTSELNSKKVNKVILEKYNHKWSRVLFDINKGEYDLIIDGTLTIAASPIIKDKRTLAFSEDADLERIKQIEDTKLLLDNFVEQNMIFNKYIVDAALNCFKPVRNIQGEIFNVGQGNSILFCNNGKNIIFDVGRSKYNYPDELKYINYFRNNIKKREIDVVILSHWHMDHLEAVTEFETSVYEKAYWLVADYTRIPGYKLGIGMLRLCAYLLLYNKISFVNRRYSVYDDQCGKICLQVGTEESKKGNYKNNIGILLHMQYKNNYLLFTGDCEYNKMPSCIKKHCYDFIVSPHHGSEYALANIFGKEHARAVISVGYNTYGHPSSKHIAALKQCGFSVYFTCGSKEIQFKFDTDDKIKMKQIK